MSWRTRWAVVILAFLVLLGGFVYAIHLAQTARSETSREAIARQTATNKVLHDALATICRANGPRDAALVALLQDRGVRVKISKEDCLAFATTGKLAPQPRTRIPSISQLRGLPGTPGARGKPGVQGLRGARGIAGQQGVPGTVGPPGPAGPAGDQGRAGEPGAAGAEGPAGPRGVAGSDANTADLQQQVVQLTQALAALNGIVADQQTQIAALQAAQAPPAVAGP